MPPTPPNLEIAYCDRHCLVVVKPARMLTASDKTGDETLINCARAWNAATQAEGKTGYLAPLHMLDRPVSGVVMFARSSKAAARLAEQFREGKIRKTYLAIVEDPDCLAPEAEAIFEDWLLKDHRTNVVRCVAPRTPEAKPCTLAMRRITHQNGLSLVEVRPLTGRSHQIRVQLASRGFPIVGDLKYGASREFDQAIALHARHVSFTHPISKEVLTASAPPPAAWESLIHVQKT